MSINMSPCGSTLEEQLSSIMDVLAKAAVSEISQLFSEGSATLRLQITESRKENESLRTRMKVMRSELFSLRIQTRSNASRTASRFALARANICKPRTTSLGNGLKPLVDHKAVGHSPVNSPSKSEASSVTSPAEETPNIIVIKIEEDMSGCRPAEDCDAFGDRSTPSIATLESLHVDAPGSSHVSSQTPELRILSVHGQGGGKLVVDGHDTLFTASEVEALNSLSADYSAAKSLDCGERLDCPKEQAVQLKFPILIHNPKETPDTILIKEEEDIGGCMPHVEDCDAFGDRSTQSGAALESLHVDAPGSSSLSSQNAALRILSVHGKGGGKLVVDGHDTLFTASEVEALNSLSADYSAAKSLDCGERLDCPKEQAVQLKFPLLLPHPKETPDTILIKEEEDIGGSMPPVEDCNYIKDCSTQHGATSDSLHPDAPGSSHMSSHKFSPVYSREKPWRCDQCMKDFKRGYDLKIHMRVHSREKPYRCDQCMKGFRQSYGLKIHMRIHSGEKPYRCDKCMKGFRRSYDLKIHMSIHSGEKPYRCDQCTKCFSQSCSLKAHMRTHSGEKPCVCHYCNISYSRASSLRRHMSKHKGKGVL